jgi:hypothetical protein
MHIIRARFEPTVAFPETLPSSFPRLISDAIEPADGIEHWHTAVRGEAVDVTLFILRSTLAEAEEMAMEICVRLIANTSRAPQWRLSQCTVSLIGPATTFLAEPEPEPG